MVWFLHLTSSLHLSLNVDKIVFQEPEGPQGMLVGNFTFKTSKGDRFELGLSFVWRCHFLTADK